MAVTENFLKTNSCRAIPLILLPCLHCLLSCRYDVYQDASIKEPSSFPPHESITELYKDFYNRSINSRSIREYWYPLVEVLTVVVEVVVNSISTDSISKSLIWTTEERNRINERELGKARIPHSDALRCFTTEPHHGFHVSLSHARDKTKNNFLYLFNGLKTYHLCYSIYKHDAIIHELRNGPRST